MKKIYFFCILKALKKGVGSRSGAGSGSISQRYESEDPESHKNVTDPQHCVTLKSFSFILPSNLYIYYLRKQFGIN